MNVFRLQDDYLLLRFYRINIFGLPLGTLNNQKSEIFLNAGQTT